jgi:hypothetical protein
MQDKPEDSGALCEIYIATTMPESTQNSVLNFFRNKAMVWGTHL